MRLNVVLVGHSSGEEERLCRDTWSTGVQMPRCYCFVVGFEICPMKSIEEAETNHLPTILTASFFGRQPPHALKSHYDDLEARNALPDVNTGSNPRLLPSDVETDVETGLSARFI